MGAATMRIFVAGATGVIGQRLVPGLVEGGHEVTALTRSCDRARRLRSIGATPAVGDVYDVGALTAAVRDAEPEVVVHLLTSLPRRFRPRAATTATDRIRREGTRNLLRAASAAGARRVIAESIAFLYAPGPWRAATEGQAPYVDAPAPFDATVAAVLDLERQVLAAEDLEGIVLRFGWLYGPGTWYAPDGSIGRDVRRRRHPIVGDGAGVFSFLHVDDAAGAAQAALGQVRAGIYNVADDDPAPVREWLPVYAAALGAPRPLRIPASLVRLIAGAAAATLATRLSGADNRKARRELGWAPRHPTWRTGLGH
jgi:nucleoside-diphosphate-sugar epimerase